MNTMILSFFSIFLSISSSAFLGEIPLASAQVNSPCFERAVFSCYDGTTFTESAAMCKTSAVWHSFAVERCKVNGSRTSGDGSVKSGVNSFRVEGAVSSESTASPYEGVSNNMLPTTERSPSFLRVTPPQPAPTVTPQAKIKPVTDIPTIAPTLPTYSTLKMTPLSKSCIISQEGFCRVRRCDGIITRSVCRQSAAATSNVQ